MTHNSIATHDPNLAEFLTELGALSRSYGLGLTDGATVYIMEPVDYSRAYNADGDSSLTFA